MVYISKTEKERLLKIMKIPPHVKLEWLREMNEFACRFPKKHHKAVGKKLGELYLKYRLDNT